MASRKKKQGKLRKAAKAAEAKAEAEARQVAEDEHEEQPQPQPLGEEDEDRLDDHLIRQDPVPSMNLPHSPPIVIDKFWTQPREEAGDHCLRLRHIKCGSSCWHSLLHEVLRTNIPEFVSTFRNAYVRHRGSRELTIANLFTEAPADMWRHFVTVWKYPQKILQIASYCLTEGADSIIDRRYDDARFYASFASYFGQYSLQSNLVRAENFFSAHEHTVIRFFKKYIFCSCLNWSNVEIDVEMEEVQPAEDNQFAWLDSVLQHYESLYDAIEDETYDLCDMSEALSESEIDSFAKHPSSEETLLKLELSRHYTELEEVKMYMRTTQVEAYAYLNFALDQLSRHALLLNLGQHQEEFEFRWPTEGSGKACTHGCETCTPQFSLSFFSLLEKFMHECNDSGGTIGRKFRAAYHATRGKYRYVWNDPINMKCTTSFLLGVGAQKAIIGNYNAARLYAAIAYFFEQHISTTLFWHDNRKAINWPKVNELYCDPDEHTLISFFRKRIRCSCLDEKYKEVKSIAKLGICCNLECRHPKGKVERSTMKCCSRCHLANYCSRKCQVENWSVHKKFCQQSYQLGILDLYRRNHQRRN